MDALSQNGHRVAVLWLWMCFIAATRSLSPGPHTRCATPSSSATWTARSPGSCAFRISSPREADGDEPESVVHQLLVDLVRQDGDVPSHRPPGPAPRAPPSWYAAPVGLEGLFSTKSFVLFRDRLSSWAGVILKPVACLASTITGVASARSAMVRIRDPVRGRG